MTGAILESTGGGVVMGVGWVEGLGGGVGWGSGWAGVRASEPHETTTDYPCYIYALWRKAGLADSCGTWELCKPPEDATEIVLGKPSKGDIADRRGT